MTTQTLEKKNCELNAEWEGCQNALDDSESLQAR